MENCDVVEKIYGNKKTALKENKISLIICNQLIIARNKKGKKLLWVSQLYNTQIITNYKDLKQNKPLLFDTLSSESSNGLVPSDLFIILSSNRIQRQFLLFFILFFFILFFIYLFYYFIFIFIFYLFNFFLFFI